MKPACQVSKSLKPILFSKWNQEKYQFWNGIQTRNGKWENCWYKLQTDKKNLSCLPKSKLFSGNDPTMNPASKSDPENRNPQRHKHIWKICLVKQLLCVLKFLQRTILWIFEERNALLFSLLLCVPWRTTKPSFWAFRFDNLCGISNFVFGFQLFSLSWFSFHHYQNRFVVRISTPISGAVGAVQKTS